MRYRLPLVANVPAQVRFKGRNITIMDTGAASEVTMSLNAASQQDQEDFGEVGRNFSIFSPERDFTGATFTATVNATIDFIVTGYRIETLDGTTLNATLSASQVPLPVTVSGPNPLPVQNDRGGNVGTPLFVSGTVLGDTPAASMTDRAAVACGPVEAAILAADATRLEARFTNIGADAVAIGKTGLTWAKRAVVLQPGDTWVETRGAAFAWVGITDAAKAATVTVQELKS